MAHRPEQPLIVVVNADGSGYVLQFNNLSEAKEAYKTITTDGVAYLYPQPKKSLSSKPIGSPAPISSTGEDVAITGGIAGNVKKGMSFNSSQNIGADTVIGEQIVCLITTIEDIDGMPHTGPYLKESIKTYSSGKPPTTDYTNDGVAPCFYPNGYRITYQSRLEDSKIETKTIYSLDFSGTLYGPYYNPSYILRLARTYTVADGNGGTRQELENGVARFENSSANKYTTTWVQYFNGDAPYKFNFNDLSITDPIGSPIPNGRYLVTYKVNGDERIHSGAWVGRIDDPVSATVVWKFEPESPEQPPPPPCSITRKRRDANDVVIDECDPTIVYPFSVTDNCEPDATVSIDESLIVIGSNTKNGMNNGYGDITWGECSGMVYKPYGTAIYDNADYNFFSDGLGSYYSEEKYHPPTCEDSGLHTGEVGWTYDGCYWTYVNPCLPAETTIEQDATSPFNIPINGTEYRAGTRIFNIVANGDCTTSEDSIRFEYYTNGTQIGNDFDYNYFSDGSGGYYSEGRPACEDSTLHTSGVDGWTYDGCNWSYSEQAEDPMLHDGEAGWSYDGFHWTYSEPPSCPSYGTQTDSGSGDYTVNLGCGDWTVGNYYYSSYADGNCGSYGDGQSSYVQNGQYIGNCNDYNYYSNGSGGYYQGEYTGTVCDSYGTYIAMNSDVYLIDFGCGTILIGDWNETVYADGTCGSYAQRNSNYYYPYGAFITNCYENNYFSDGNGGYFIW